MNHLARPPCAPGGWQTKPATPRNREAEATAAKRTYGDRATQTILQTTPRPASDPKPRPAEATPPEHRESRALRTKPMGRQRLRPARDIPSAENHAPYDPSEAGDPQTGAGCKREEMFRPPHSTAALPVLAPRDACPFRSRQLDNPPAPRNLRSLRDHYAGKQAWSPIQI